MVLKQCCMEGNQQGKCRNSCILKVKCLVCFYATILSQNHMYHKKKGTLIFPFLAHFQWFGFMYSNWPPCIDYPVNSIIDSLCYLKTKMTTFIKCLGFFFFFLNGLDSTNIFGFIQ